MKKDELKTRLGIVLENFDQNPNMEMSIFIDKVAELADKYLEYKESAIRKKAITDYLTTEHQDRGQLTDRIKLKSIELLGYEISQTELRLMPYLQYQLVNEQRLNPRLLNKDDKKILVKWVEMGYILDGVSPRKGRPMMSEGASLKVTKEFWDSILEILWLGYVDLHP